MNATLEAMARALFRDWFVDFGPTRAKMQGREPYLAPDLWPLFPARLDGEGKPEGWQEIPVGELATIRGGKQLPRTEFVEGGAYPVFGGAGVMGRTDKFNAEGFVISVGRVGAYCGQFFAHRGRAWVNNNASLITPKEGVQGEWLFLALKNLDISLIKKGAAQPFISNSDLAGMKVMVADRELMSRFQEAILPVRQRLEANERESRTLAQTRDLLLPRLMSGEFRVAEAEKIVEGEV